MSNRIFQAVWDCGPGSRSEMLVLMVLADSADAETASSFPSVAHIARMARMSKRSAQSALQSLEQEGWITREKRSRENGSERSSLYVIELSKLGLTPIVRNRGAKTAPPPAKSAPLGVQKLPGTGGAKTAPLEQTIYNKEPAALFEISSLSPFQRSEILAGRNVLLGTTLCLSTSPEAQTLRNSLRNESSEKGGDL